MHSSKCVVDQTKLHKDDIQPNGFDIRVKKIYRIELNTPAVLTETSRQVCTRFEMFPQKTHFSSTDVTFGWHLIPGSYEFETDIEIEIPENHLGIVHQRSTLSRSTVTVTSGLWDSGYRGYLNGQIITRSPLILEHSVRIAQFILWPVESIKKYDGIYQNKTTSEALMASQRLFVPNDGASE